MAYTAKTLLYLRDPVERPNEDGEMVPQEYGYVEIGERVPLPDDDPRIPTWLEIDAIEAIEVLQPETKTKKPKAEVNDGTDN